MMWSIWEKRRKRVGPLAVESETVISGGYYDTLVLDYPFGFVALCPSLKCTMKSSVDSPHVERRVRSLDNTIC